jgi:hypothetical protein
MFLESKHIPEIQRLLTSGAREGIERIQGSEMSLTVALFLGLVHRSLLGVGDFELAKRIAQLEIAEVQDAIECLGRKGSQICPVPFGAPSFDLYRIGSKQDLLSPEWTLFYDRFRRSASRGRKSPMYRGVGGILGEMGDNVVWHAFEAENKPCPALAAFHVTDAAASFCVADWGQGFLRSLRRSPTWGGLKSEAEALDAVVSRHATSRVGEAEGGGFKQLFNSLLDFNGLVVLRSGSCTFRLENCGAARRVSSREAFQVPGATITVVISCRGHPAELPLKNSS